jgi:hypothetical protein
MFPLFHISKVLSVSLLTYLISDKEFSFLGYGAGKRTFIAVILWNYRCSGAPDPSQPFYYKKSHHTFKSDGSLYYSLHRIRNISG